MSPDQWLENHFHGEYFSGNFDHLKLIVKKLQLNPKQSKVITIAGTNGKGETSRTLSWILSQTHSVKTWTSPHIVSVCERFCLNQKPIDASELVRLFESLKSNLQSELNQLSYFEFLFLAFLSWNQSKPSDFIVLEVGLGGRLDACNVIDTDCAVICSISRDHQQILGNRYEQILREKLGITRSNKPLITCFELEYLRSKTQAFIAENKTDWTDLFLQGLCTKSDDFSKRNQTLAKVVAQAFNIEVPASSLPFYAMRASFNFEQKIFDLYPSHNVDGLRKLVQFLELRQYTRLYDLVLVAFSRRSYEDIAAVCRILLRVFKQDQIKLVHFNHIKSVDRELLKQVQEDFKFELFEEEKIYNQLKSRDQKILVTGSNYFLGNILSKRPRKK